MKKLQAMRKNKGLSQKELANASGVNKRVIQCHEQTRNIDKANLYRILPIVRALGCSIQDILEDENLIKMVDEYEQTEDYKYREDR